MTVNNKILKAMSDVPGMDESEIRRFLLAGKTILKIATLEEDGSPVIYPIWFDFGDDRIYFMTGKNTRKAGNVFRSSNKVYFCIDTEGQPYRGVKGKANASIVNDAERARKIALGIIRKYMGEGSAESEKELTDGISTGEDVLVELRPMFYSTWDYEKLQRESG
jgi:nitroimidazol reductase NimA-like FMN-containing flavoprotein (pyridoxamine 5'-phosphate oxidase superfamily)